MKHLISILTQVVLITMMTVAQTPQLKQLPANQDVNIEVQRIWSNGEYCSFTSFAKYKGKYFVSFRESNSHQILKPEDQNGKARIIYSEDGREWKSSALIAKEGYDLRDPKISIMPDGRMMLIMGGCVYKNCKREAVETWVCFSDDGEHFSELQPVVFPDEVAHGNEFLWRITWHDGVGYGVSYGSFFSLIKTTDGIHYELVSHINMPGFPNESTIRFLSDGTMAMMVRRENDSKNGAFGLSKPPYVQWKWNDMDVRLGGPDFMLTSDSTMIVASRSMYSTEKTMLFSGDTRGKIEEVCILPSGGDDNSYTGMLVEGDQLWVTYYSKHEGPKASIYLAKVPLKLFQSGVTSRYFY
ncbi:MAG: exo-alpha-sialidase [Bacteroidales bacterium]|nr:exo-alpha-sialidase [Candidatus Colimorpha onthohippi]